MKNVCCSIMFINVASFIILYRYSLIYSRVLPIMLLPSLSSIPSLSLSFISLFSPYLSSHISPPSFSLSFSLFLSITPITFLSLYVSLSFLSLNCLVPLSSLSFSFFSIFLSFFLPLSFLFLPLCIFPSLPHLLNLYFLTFLLYLYFCFSPYYLLSLYSSFSLSL